MELSQVDKNMIASDAVGEVPMTRYDIPDPRFALYGVRFDAEDGFYRMPEADAAKVSEKVCSLRRNTSGGRLRFRTDATVMELTVSWNRKKNLTHMAPSGVCGFTLMEVTENGYRYAALFRMAPGSGEQGFTCRKELPGGKMREYILYFPLYNNVKALSISFDEGAAVERGAEYSEKLPMVFYGSSITQGACASSPNGPYMAYLSEWNDLDYLNFGFSGSAKGEPAMAEYLAKIPARIFIMDYDHNATTVEHLEKTHEPFFRIYRAANPTTPILLASSVNYWKNPEHYAKKRAVILQTYRNAVAAGDRNVWFLDGATMYSAEEMHHCTSDNLHPNDHGFYLMAKAMQPVIREILKSTV